MAGQWRRVGSLGAAALGLGLAASAREVFARSREADLHGQVALITGGSRGLGLAIARELAAEGCRLAICAREFDELDRAAKDLEANGATVFAVTCDVTDETAVQTMVADVIAHYGQIDLLITVAGVIEVGMLEDLVVDDFRHTMDVMFWGTLYPIMACLPSMRARKSGRIATITSIGGKVAVPRFLSYTAAKFAAVGLSEGLAAELAQDGISVTTIAPGVMRTGSHLNARFKGDSGQQNADYTWFSVGASLPVNPRADRAAKIIVRSIKRGETERIFPFPYVLFSRLHGLAPATTIRLMQVANAILPNASIGGSPTKERGTTIKDRIDSRVLNLATTLADEAVDDFNERPGPVHTVDA